MKHYTPEKKVECLRLNKEGYTRLEISNKTGLSVSLVGKLFKRASDLRIDGEPPTCPADVASMFPSSLFITSAGQPKPRVKVSEYMTYKIWQAMDEDQLISCPQVMKALPCLAGVSPRKVRDVMATIRKNLKTEQPQPEPPKPLLFAEMPLLATKKWCLKQLRGNADDQHYQ